MLLGFFAWYFSFITVAHILLAALNLAISSKKFIEELKKNYIRGAKSSMFNPAFIPISM